MSDKPLLVDPSKALFVIDKALIESIITYLTIQPRFQHWKNVDDILHAIHSLPLFKPTESDDTTQKD